MKNPLHILIWQWGRFGAGPKIAVELTKALKKLENHTVFLSLSKQAEVLSQDINIDVDVPVKTYSSILGYLLRWLQAPFMVISLYLKLKKKKIDFAICTMTGPLDLLMAFTLKWLKIPIITIVHDARPHLGDGYVCQYFLQKQLIKRSSFVVTFSDYVFQQLLKDDIVTPSKIIKSWHPPFNYTYKKSKQHSSSDVVKLLNFGRLLPYKGLDLLEDSLKKITTQRKYTLRIVGHGPQTPILDKLNKKRYVSVENRWIAEGEVESIIQWADVLILPYREASQSGVGAIALAYGKPVLITNVGGLEEQFKEKDLVFLCEPNPTDIAKKIDEILELSFPIERSKEDAEQGWQNMASTLVKNIQDKLTFSKRN